MTGRAAGRHRVPREPSERRPESLLLLEYQPDGLREFTGLREFDGLRDFPIASASQFSASQFDTIRFGTGQFDTGRTGRRRALSLSAALAVVLVAAVVIGGFALLRSSGRTGSGKNAIPGFPPPATATASAPQRANSPSPGTRKPHHRRGASQTTAPRQPNRVSMPAAAPHPTQQAGKQQAGKQSATVSVRYLVASQGPGGFQGEVQVTNNTAQAIAGWQLVIALQDDDVVSFTNATGYVSNGILLLSPANGAQVVPPDGGTLAVFFVAEGTQTIPDACAFNGISCGS